jgi:hypothetical protein
MEEQGVSKIVSVKFHKVEEDMIGQKPAPLVPPTSAPVDDEEDRSNSREETLEIVMAR